MARSRYAGSFADTSIFSGVRGTILAFAIVAQAAYVLWVAYRPSLPDVEPYFTDIALLLGAALATAVCMAAAMAHRGTRFGAAWLGIGVGMACFAIGEGLWTVQELAINKDVGIPSIADVGYLSAYPLVIVGLLMMPQTPTAPISRLRMLMDVAVGTIAVAAIVMEFVIKDILADSTLGGTATAVSVAYPLADVAVMAVAFVLLARTTGGWPRLRIVLLALAFVSQAVASLSSGGTGSAGIADVGWFTSYTLVTAAAVLAIGPWVEYSDEREADAPVPLWQAASAYVAVVPLGVIALMRTDLLFTAATFAVMAIMYCRQFLATAENTFLNRQLAELNRVLQMRTHEAKLQAMTAGAAAREGGFPNSYPREDAPTDGFPNAYPGDDAPEGVGVSVAELRGDGLPGGRVGS